MTELQQRIIAAARECLGTPFRHQGRIAGMGLDCAGLAVHVIRALGLPFTDERGYSRLPHKGRLQAAIDAQPSLARVRDAAPGDVLLIRIGSEPSHVAIDCGETMIHAYQHVGRVCEHRLDEHWTGAIVQRYRITQEHAA